MSTEGAVKRVSWMTRRPPIRASLEGERAARPRASVAILGAVRTEALACPY